MRSIVLVCLFAVAATAAVLPADSYLPAEEKSNGVEYLPPSIEEPTKEYLPSAEVKEAVEVTEAPEESAVLADDGYRYKTVRRLKYRHRRDVNEIENEYLPPVEEPTKEYLPAAEVKEAVEVTEAPEESSILADDGYRYKTVRRLKYRHRRDVNEIENEYLPPVDVATEEVAEVKEAEVTEAPEESAVLADDGYRYKTVRRLKYRHRRDANEIENEYLPPVEEATEEVAEVKEAEVTEAPEESAVLADDGYRYKTVRRLKYRHRRDVNEIANEYLPPVDEPAEEEVAEIKEAEVAEAPEESAVLADDGYRYKTIRRLKYRHRRDVNEIENEYLPPVEEPTKEYLPAAEVKEAVEVTEAPEESAILADDGYRYKTVRRLKYRHRRDVNEIENEYLPPVEVATEEVAEIKEAEVTEAPEESAVLADDGYRYKTVRRLKYRHRRDVNEIENEYLPPVEEATEEVAEVKEAEVTEAPEESAVLADDGYRYKTVRRLKYRHRRDVNEIANEYLPPVDEPAEEEVAEIKEAEVAEAPEESAVLADDGYRYKTVRRLKYRHRRDVNEIENEYLPPVEEPTKEYLPAAEVNEAVEVTEAPEESAILADDGYRYKTVRRLKYRHRRDVNEIANEYLPPVDLPTEEVAEVKEAEVAEAPEESAVLADDGYRYKTVRRLKYRHRRDVNEIENEYLPPVEVATEEVAEVKEAEVTEAPEESAVLADDGYRYKTVRRLKYRHRRDVNEIANEYLPPVDEPAEEVAEIKEAEVAQAPEESAVLADDGYRYKTVRRLKYRHRRDVNEIENEYLPPVEEPTKEYLPAAEVKEAVEVTEAPEESAVLADDGYHYKTVRRLKYRHRRDVNEIENEYLPPVEEATEEVAEVKEAEVTEAPEESAVLANDGYRYKTVRRLKYRHRRDVSEIVAPEYLPPVEKVTNEYLPPAEQVAEATESPIAESAVLADDGYRYKTVKRFRYRN